MALESRFLKVFALAGLLLTGCQPSLSGSGGAKAPEAGDAASAPPATPVEVVSAERRPLLATYTGTAALEAEREAQVVAKTSGVLLRLRTEEGQFVRAGQVLAELDPERATLEVARAEANLRRLENDFRRSRELYEAKLISAESHDRIRFDLETQRAAYDLARLELSYTRIVAPIDGIISQRLVKEGNLIQLHQPLFRIDDFDPLLAVLNVPERELRSMAPGMPVTMQVDALGNAAFDGVVARVSPVVDPATGTFRVTAEFRDPTGQLKSGMFGRVAVIYDRRPDVLMIPREALLQDAAEPAVFVVRAGVAVRQVLRTGASDGAWVEVLDGVTDGEPVVTVGGSALRDGVAVQVLEAAP